MIEKWKMSVDKRKNIGALLTDLSKAVSFLPYDLTISNYMNMGLVYQHQSLYSTTYLVESKEHK